MLLLLGLCGGCGTRSALSVEPPASRSDAGDRDAGFDGGTDGGSELVVDCGRAEQFTTPRVPRMLVADVSGPFAIVQSGWEILESTPGTEPVILEQTPPGSATYQTLRSGEVLFAFTARDSDGAVASCEVLVRSVVGPPVAICPEEPLLTVVNVPVTVEADYVEDEMVASLEWAIVEQPRGSNPVLTGDEGATTEFSTPDAGTYVLRFSVTDIDDASDACEVAVRVTGPPRVSCPDDYDAPTRQGTRFEARDSDDVGIVSRGWELLSRPATSMAELELPEGQANAFTPDRQGEYRLRYTVEDVEGFTASCETVVTGTPTPPTVTCPATVEIAPLATGEVRAVATDDGTIVSWRWTVTDRPTGSAASSTRPANTAVTRFTPDIAGIYTLSVTATDDDGSVGTCETQVLAGNIDGLRVEMIWNTDGTDIDLHLLNPDGTRWNSEEDCYYANCNTSSSGGEPVLEWYGPSDEDDPRLDIDNTTGRGPENINIERPEPGTYRIGVHNFAGAGPNGVTVNVYCGGSTTEPRQVFGPATLRTRRGRTDFWRVADVTIARGGCTIEDLRTSDGAFWIEAFEDAVSSR